MRWEDEDGDDGGRDGRWRSGCLLDVMVRVRDEIAVMGETEIVREVEGEGGDGWV